MAKPKLVEKKYLNEHDLLTINYNHMQDKALKYELECIKHRQENHGLRSTIKQLEIRLHNVEINELNKRKETLQLKAQKQKQERESMIAELTQKYELEKPLSGFDPDTGEISEG